MYVCDGRDQLRNQKNTYDAGGNGDTANQHGSTRPSVEILRKTMNKLVYVRKHIDRWMK